MKRVTIPTAGVILKFILLNSVVLLASASAVDQPRWQSCLPKGIKVDEVISVDRSTGRKSIDKVNVKDRLNEIRARCRNGKMVDSGSKEIRFFRLVGCWGNAPANYLEILERQRSQLRDLKKRYTVIEIPCNPAGLLIP